MNYSVLFLILFIIVCCFIYWINCMYKYFTIKNKCDKSKKEKSKKNLIIAPVFIVILLITVALLFIFSHKTDISNSNFSFATGTTKNHLVHEI